LITGSHGKYYWLVWRSRRLWELIAAFPEIVHEKHLVVTSCDSGPYQLSDQELQQGWQTRDGAAYSPRITDTNQLPDEAGYDEWYILDMPKSLDHLEVFINYSGFRLQYEASDIAMNKLLERFWFQIETLAPESYLAEGDNLVFVTCNAVLYGKVHQWQLPRAEHAAGQKDTAG
jgi:hypothetical protein